MGRPEARSAQISRPDGVARSFQVSRYKVEPTEAVLARNLLSKDDWRAALLDEIIERGPEVPLVISPASLACRAERLARARAGPDRPVVGPSRSAEGKAPASDTGEEVALSVAPEFIRSDVTDVPFVHVSGRDMPASDQFPQPSRGFGVELVVVGRHQ